MARVISLFLPTWSTDRVRRNEPALIPETPLALIGRVGAKRVVTAADRAARSAGITPGMAAVKASAILPGLEVRNAAEAEDEEALERLALWALRRYSPVVAADAPDGIIIDATGAAHLFGGEEAMLTDLLGRVSLSGTAARVAIADTLGAAHAAARFGREGLGIIPEGEEVSLLRTLPLAALRLPPSTLAGLRKLGFAHVEDVFAQARAPLTLRFGPELFRRIDQATGALPEPIVSVRSPEIIEVRRNFAEPISAAETIARYIGQLVEDLCTALEEKGYGARVLDLICHRVDGQAQALRVGMAQPVRDIKRMTRLLCDRIEKIDPGFGIEVMTLAAVSAESLDQRQQATDLIDAPEADVGDLVDMLANRIGGGRIYRVTAVASDVPERSVKKIPAMAPATGEGWPDHWPRPSRLIAPPEAVEAIALLPDHPPVSFTWRGVRRRVKRADGPERVFGEWWKANAETQAVRDYFRVEDEAGERYWIFRAGDGEDPATGSHRWYLHGVFG